MVEQTALITIFVVIIVILVIFMLVLIPMACFRGHRMNKWRRTLT